MSDIMSKIGNMLNSNDVPDSIKEVMNNLSNSNNNSSNNNNSNSNTGSANKDNNFNITPEMLSAFMNTLGNNSSSNSNNDSSNNSTPNIDMETLLKMKTVMEKMNSKDDPGSKLLLSLKPYLRNERKNKVEQYVKFLNMGKLIDVFNLSGGGKAK